MSEKVLCKLRSFPPKVGSDGAIGIVVTVIV